MYEPLLCINAIAFLIDLLVNKYNFEFPVFSSGKDFKAFPAL